MRISKFSFFLYSLSLVTVTAGQSAFVSDVGNLLPSGSASASSTETTETSTSESATESSTSVSETSSPTITQSSATPTSTTDSSSSTTDSTSSTDSSSTPSSSQDATTTSDPTTTGSTTSEPTTSTPKTITTTHTISGTPLPTTMTSDEASQATSTPSLSTSSKDNNNSGLSSHNKQVIIGVVVGVGGALIIGALGVVIWRIRATKGGRSDADEATDLMSGTAVGTGNREKAPSPGANNSGTPFRSTLDQYHNPGPVNAASNF